MKLEDSLFAGNRWKILEEREMKQFPSLAWAYKDVLQYFLLNIFHFMIEVYFAYIYGIIK